ncbi:MAG: amidohydrolase family protein [Candidatus Bipolaricaulota bacterium]
MFDLLLKSPTVVDPLAGVNEVRDIGIKDGRVASNETELDPGDARQVLDLAGKVAMPGIVDSHTHFSREGNSIGQKMMASVGVTTAIDFSSRPKQLVDAVRKDGAGLNVGALYPLIPFDTISSRDPSPDELEDVIAGAAENGALGIKLLGGHHPITPETAAQAIEIANANEIYVASHLGTTETGSDLRGLREIPDIVKDYGLHIAHVNSYCRGAFKPPIEESLEAVSILQGLGENVVSESYLGTINGTSGECKEGQPASHVTRNCLEMKDYPPTKDGLEESIREGYCFVVAKRGDQKVLLSGREGVEVWEEAETDVGISFPVNSSQSTFFLATCKREGDFVVDAISTDGGSYPRNHIVDRGLALVDYGALTFSEFVQKVSAAPAQMFGLEGKGSLQVGYDGDVTVLDTDRNVAVMSVVEGKVRMINGIPIDQGGTLLTTEKGKRALSSHSFPVKTANMEISPLYS